MQIPYRKPGKDSQVKPDPFLTADKVAAMEVELARLINHSRPKAIEDSQAAAQNGDFSENVEYQIAKGRLRGINHRILVLEHQLKQAVIINPEKNSDTVELGHTVTIESAGKQKTFQILGSSETDPVAGIISHNSPIGEALIGHRVGETVTIKPADREIQYKIIKIS
ncbi:MAG: GreA/GreB family elongation factor [bacterium]|nr:GreA/GreB family elongation factor [bacterium]